MIRLSSSVLLALIAVTPTSAAQDPKPAETKPAWEAAGTLYEACSCSVPCPCNFRQSPTRGYCYTVYAYRLKKAHIGEVNLDGLVFGGGEADKEPMGFLDSLATAAQRTALEKLALAVFAKGGPSAGKREFVSAKLETTGSESQFSVRFGSAGGFTAEVLLGGDNKTPIVVENNSTWPVHRFTKGKTIQFDYKDAHGNVLKYDGVNANLGEFNLKP